MIKLYQYAPCWGLPSASPFCMKLETWLRMSGIPYEIHVLQDPRKTPKGKLPIIDDEGKVIADSSIIINYLSEKYNIKMDAHLSDTEKAYALGLKHLIEDHLYWAIVYSRWMDPSGWKITKEAYFKSMPSFLRMFLPDLIRKDVIKALKAQGLGRHTPEEIYQFGMDDVTALSHALGNNPYISGKNLTNLDATAYAFIMNILQSPIESPLKKHAMTFANLRDYCKHMSEAFYPGN